MSRYAACPVAMGIPSDNFMLAAPRRGARGFRGISSLAALAPVFHVPLHPDAPPRSLRLSDGMPSEMLGPEKEQQR